jgi:hypothetical protein
MMKTIALFVLCIVAAGASASASAQGRSRPNAFGELTGQTVSDWRFPARGMKAKRDKAGDATYLLGKDSQGRPYYASRIRSDGRDAVMVRVPDSLYASIAKNAEGDAPDFILAGVAFGYACHPKGADFATSHVSSMHPEYRFLTRSGRVAHVITGRDKTIVMVWIEPLARRGRNKRR